MAVWISRDTSLYSRLTIARMVLLDQFTDGNAQQRPCQDGLQQKQEMRLRRIVRRRIGKARAWWPDSFAATVDGRRGKAKGPLTRR
jgi:hypothetical protein